LRTGLAYGLEQPLALFIDGMHLGEIHAGAFMQPPGLDATPQPP
jgi:hypothetical protein